MGRDTGQVPRQTPRLPDPAELVRRRLAYERQVREWSTSEVARRLTDAGFKISQSSVWSIESDPRRKVTFAEAVAFADLYGLELADLLKAPRDISSQEFAELFSQLTTFQRDARALLSGLSELLERVSRFTNTRRGPGAADDLFNYLGMSELGVPTDDLRKNLVEAADTIRRIADALPDQAIVFTFARDEASEGDR